MIRVGWEEGEESVFEEEGDDEDEDEEEVVEEDDNDDDDGSLDGDGDICKTVWCCRCLGGIVAAVSPFKLLNDIGAADRTNVKGHT